MRPLLNTAVTNFCLIAIFLWAQIAVAHHNAEHGLAHVGHEASEVCETYASADNAKVVLSIVPLVLNVEVGLDALLFDKDYFLNAQVNTFGARAPPINVA